GLRGEADTDHDGYVTGAELGEFLQKQVMNYSQNTQHPQYGKLRHPYLDKGDFVFLVSASPPPSPSPSLSDLQVRPRARAAWFVVAVASALPATAGRRFAAATRPAFASTVSAAAS